MPTVAAEYYIGLMSGTSADGMDAALVRFDSHDQLQVEAFISQPYSTDMVATLRQAAIAGQLAVDQILDLERAIADYSATAVQALLQQTGVASQRIKAIGSHGHTLRHRPTPPVATWQIGDSARIAELTGITVVADFRRRDIAAGGQGAPLVPAFHARFLGQNHVSRMVLNIGGIANISVIQPGHCLGFDTGPGNALMDEWCQIFLQQRCDFGGQLARQGQIDKALLQQWLALDFFRQPPPRSTGRELFCLQQLPGGTDFDCHADALATLTELTARSIVAAVAAWGLPQGQLLVCGGGARNHWLMERLQVLLPQHQVATTEIAGIHPDSMEATAFAWLARQTLNGLTGNLPPVTGAAGPRILGAIYPA